MTTEISTKLLRLQKQLLNYRTCLLTAVVNVEKLSVHG
jgi:hypothetical protein